MGSAPRYISSQGQRGKERRAQGKRITRSAFPKKKKKRKGGGGPARTAGPIGVTGTPSSSPTKDTSIHRGREGKKGGKKSSHILKLKLLPRRKEKKRGREKEERDRSPLTHLAVLSPVPFDQKKEEGGEEKMTGPVTQCPPPLPLSPNRDFVGEKEEKGGGGEGACPLSEI